MVEDRAMPCELWKPSFKILFPDGAEDPNIVLLHITGEHAEYWDNSGANQFRYLYQSLNALAAGSTPDIKEGNQHGNVTLID
ncbi:MAG: pyridoxamine 5'-phosphate oxidase family protein [Gloeobacteraceae cyanobacterium ES-bin-144]|nr:pyridoxamine 5'-phosphate oxidase family protein [Verrucomicrobiales bacterium]